MLCDGQTTAVARPRASMEPYHQSPSEWAYNRFDAFPSNTSPCGVVLLCIWCVRVCAMFDFMSHKGFDGVVKLWRHNVP